MHQVAWRFPKTQIIIAHLWIAKFPSRRDEIDVGKWEYLVYLLAQNAGIDVSQSKICNFSGEYHTFLTKRFDRTETGERLQFTSAMTLLGKKDGDGGDTGVSYLDLAGLPCATRRTGQSGLGAALATYCFLYLRVQYG